MGVTHKRGLDLMNEFTDHFFAVTRNRTVNLQPNPSALTAEDSLHSDSDLSQSQSYITTDVSRPACLGLRTAFYYCQDSCGFVDTGRYLWREDGCVVYNFCWTSSAQSFSGSNPVGLVTIFYCLRLETSLFVASYDSQGYGGGIRTRLHTGKIYDSAWVFCHISSGLTDRKYLLFPYPRKCLLITRTPYPP
jgi:hypothetical protein